MENLSNIFDYRIVLASKSPRRLQLVKQMGFKVISWPIDINEDYPIEFDFEKIPEFLARKKSESFDKSLLDKKDILLTADTMVFVDGVSLSKPKNKEEAIEFLKRLSSKRHMVITGSCLKTIEEDISFSSITYVYFKNLSSREIDYYVDNYNPYDKAGGYAIQEWIGSIGIVKIEGCYYNVMGLPTQEVFSQINKIITSNGR